MIFKLFSSLVLNACVNAITFELIILESNLKAISTPALFGRLEKGSNNSHKNATLGSGPDNCCRARLFANSPSEMIKALNRQSVQSKARTTPAISPAYFTEQTIPLRRSPRLSHQ